MTIDAQPQPPPQGTRDQSPISLSERPQWRALQRHFAEIGEKHLRELFAENPLRGAHFTAEAVGLYLDYSKQRITDETLHLLRELATACDLSARIETMFRGDKINTTEQRAVLHIALRAPADEPI
ncbi:MAG TPA: hypothetical protein VGK97_08060, partial [Spongiibacteraceae bacterium]